MTAEVTDVGASAGDVGDPARRALSDERDFLLRSLQDLEAERAAGDLDDGDYEALRSRYTARTAAVLRALAEPPGPAGDGTGPPGAHGDAGAARDRSPVAPTRRRRRRLLVGGAVACFAVAAVVLVLGELGVGLPGDPVTGSPTLTGAQQVQRLLAQGEAALVEAQSAEALAAFQQVLRLDPTQEEALAEVGWLEFAAGVHAGDRALVRRGQQQEDTAVARAPGQPAPRLYLGAMLAQEGAVSQAVSQFEAGLGDRPPDATVVVFAATIARVFAEAHVPVPGDVAADVAGVTSSP